MTDTLHIKGTFETKHTVEFSDREGVANYGTLTTEYWDIVLDGEDHRCIMGYRMRHGDYVTEEGTIDSYNWNTAKIALQKHHNSFCVYDGYWHQEGSLNETTFNRTIHKLPS